MDPALLAAFLQNATGNTTGTEDNAALTQLIALLSKMMEEDEDDDVHPRARRRAIARARDRQRAAGRVAAIQRTIRLLSRRNAFVAGALGACECWGMDHECARCGGTGSPGAFEPMETAFSTLVTPLLLRRSDLVRDHLARSRGDDANPNTLVQ